MPVHTRLGRYHVPEPPSMLRALHMHDGRTLSEVDHEPQLAVLDQENLIGQGIDTSALVTGAAKVDALGSCVFNASTAHLANLLAADAFLKLTGAASYDDTCKAEEYAIGLYHSTTDLTGDPASEWPPTDCGSSGLYVCQELQTQGVISGAAVVTGANNIVSLLQDRDVIVGQPWFNAWFEPDASGFVDQDGSPGALQAAIGSGVAGGHETCITAVEKLAIDAVGNVDPARTVLRVRNSWGKSFGDHGSYRIHLSTYVMLQSQCDFRQMHLPA